MFTRPGRGEAAGAVDVLGVFETRGRAFADGGDDAVLGDDVAGAGARSRLASTTATAAFSITNAVMAWPPSHRLRRLALPGS